MENKYYTLEELSKYFRTPINFLRKEIREHKLKASFIGKHYIISETDWDDYFKPKGVKNER